MTKYSFRSIYKHIAPLFKHKIDIYRSVEVTTPDFLTHEEQKLIYSDVDAYVGQDIRAPYLAINNDDTLRTSGYCNLHVKYDTDIRAGDYIVARIPENNNIRIMHGFVGTVRVGTATRRVLVNIDDTKEQDDKPSLP